MSPVSRLRPGAVGVPEGVRGGLRALRQVQRVPHHASQPTGPYSPFTNADAYSRRMATT